VDHRRAVATSREREGKTEGGKGSREERGRKGSGLVDSCQLVPGRDRRTPEKRGEVADSPAKSLEIQELVVRHFAEQSGGVTPASGDASVKESAANAYAAGPPGGKMVSVIMPRSRHPESMKRGASRRILGADDSPVEVAIYLVL
jgi:hypothetical protein